MSEHKIYIETVYAEELLDLPEGIFLKGAEVKEGNLVLSVVSEEDLGAPEVVAYYGNVDEDEKTVHFGMFEPKV